MKLTGERDENQSWIRGNNMIKISFVLKIKQKYVMQYSWPQANINWLQLGLFTMLSRLMGGMFRQTDELLNRSMNKSVKRKQEE